MLLIQETLIVNTSAERRVLVFHISTTAIGKTITVCRTAHNGRRSARALHRH